QAAGRLLGDLGHHVEEAWPTALEDTSFGARFGAIWSTNMGVALARFEQTLGRPLREDEAEPMNRAQAEFAKHFSSIDHALALSAAAWSRRAVHAWWHEGWDLLLTPTLAEVPLPLGTIANDADEPLRPILRSGQFVPFTPPWNTSGQPAISLPLHWSSDGL